MVFWHNGFNIYTEPTQNLVEQVQTGVDGLTQFWDWNPREFFQAPYWQNKNPLMIIWPHVPRPYPPGLFMSLTPVAGLMSLMGGMNVFVYSLTTWLYCFWAHLAFFAAWLLIKNYSPLIIKIFLGALFYHELVGWSLSSQYDPYCLLFVFLSLFYLKERNTALVVLNFALAAMIHFRILLWALIPLMALTKPFKQLVSEIRQCWSQHKWIYFLSFILLILSGICFILIYSAVSSAYHSNPLRDMILSGVWAPKAWLFVGALGVTLTYSYWIKDFFLMASVAWLSLVLLSMQFVQVWYGLFFLPLLVVGQIEKASWKELFPRLGFYFVLNFCFLNYLPTAFIGLVKTFLFRDIQ